MAKRVTKSKQEVENLPMLLEQHWLHCRHLEYERTWFLLAYLGSIASILGFVYFGTGVRWTIFIPIVLTFLGFFLTKRWSDAFEEHRDRVKAILIELGLNELYLEDGTKVDLTMHIPAGHFLKVLKTTRLFYCFYLFMIIGLILLYFLPKIS